MNNALLLVLLWLILVCYADITKAIVTHLYSLMSNSLFPSGPLTTKTALMSK